MTQRSRAVELSGAFPVAARRLDRTITTDRSSGRFTDEKIAALAEFDTEAWSNLLAEQRIRIAAAAGVDPSRVRIQIGH